MHQVWNRLRAEYARSQKPREIEDPGDLWLIRPLGFLLVILLRKTPATPNVVSGLSVVAALLTGWLYYRVGASGGDFRLAALGAASLLLYSALDSADGQLARVTGQLSPTGRLVDGTCDIVAFFTFYVAVVAGYVAGSGERPAVVIALGLAAVASHALQAGAAEYQRMLYVHYVYGDDRVRQEDPERLRREIRELRSDDDGSLGRRLFARLQLALAVGQRRLCPSSRSLRRRLSAERRRDPSLEPRVGKAYRHHQTPRMAFWALIGPNSHKLGLVATAFVPAYGTGLPWSLGIAWFLVHSVLLDAVLVYLLRSQRRVDARIFRAVVGNEPPEGNEPPDRRIEPANAPVEGGAP